MTSLDDAKASVQYAFDTASGLINDSFKYAQPYIDNHPINSNVDNSAYRDSVSVLSSGVRGVVGKYINDALVGFNTRVQNAGIDFNASSPSDDDISSLSESIQSYSDQLQPFIDDVLSRVDSLVENAAFNRSLLRPTGNRVIPIIKFDSPNTFTYEVKNVGTKPWSGYLCIVLTDEYKNSINEFSAPPIISTAEPGETTILSRDVLVPKTLYVNNKPRSWGKSTTWQISIYTRKAT
jgi:hypothetical protein